MAINLDKPYLWKSDVIRSVDMYNDWFMKFAPEAFRKTRVQSTEIVKNTFKLTNNLYKIDPDVLREHPEILPTLRMSTCPPLAVDRLIGLAGVSPHLIKRMELRKDLPPRSDTGPLTDDLSKIALVIRSMLDPDIFFWLSQSSSFPADDDFHRAATIIADRLCGAIANPIIRNAQEERQLRCIAQWLDTRGYQFITSGQIHFDTLPPRSYSFHVNMPIKLKGSRDVNIPVDIAIQPQTTNTKNIPVLIEAKSAGDFTNTNKRRKEEAVKISQLRSTYGKKNIRFLLFLCGYFDSGYLGYEAAEGIDWIWEHRIDDLEKAGL